jgi:hypothetical protein
MKFKKLKIKVKILNEIQKIKNKSKNSKIEN